MERADFDAAYAEMFGAQVMRMLGPAPADESERVQAELTVCGEVVRHLNTYRPHQVPGMPPELRAFGTMTFDEMREALTGRAGPVYSRHLAEVTDAEAGNAQRLQVLVSTVRTLARLRGKAADTGTVDRCLETIGNWTVRVWGVSPPLAADVDVSAWCRKQTWRPDALPFAWRHL